MGFELQRIAKFAVGYPTAVFCGLLTFAVVGKDYYRSPHSISNDSIQSLDLWALLAMTVVGAVIAAPWTALALLLLERLRLSAILWYLLAGVMVCILSFEALWLLLFGGPVGRVISDSGIFVAVASGAISGSVLWFFLEEIPRSPDSGEDGA